MRNSISAFICVFLLIASISCGDSKSSSEETTATYTIGGSITGLLGTLVLQNNGSDDLTVTEDGSFEFDSALEDLEVYSVSVLTQPANQNCSLANATGTLGGSDVSNIVVTCTTNTYSIGGTITGLEGGIVIQNNESDDLILTQNGSFEFATQMEDAETYLVRVSEYPELQTCSIANAAGTIAGDNVNNIIITCSLDTYSVSGVATGLVGEVTIQNNSDDDLTLTTNGIFTFETEVADTSTYAVTVTSQPDSQTCTVGNATGTIDGSHITNVALTCSTHTYAVGGTVSGLSGTVVLLNNGGDNLSVSANGVFEFDTEVVDSATYSVTVSSSPTDQNCVVTSGSGTLADAEITNVSVTCSNKTWQFQSYLKAPNAANNDSFGYAAAVDDNTIVVSSYLENSNTTSIINGNDLSGANNSGSVNGAAYVYKRSGSTWSHEAYLKAPNNSDGDQFGYSLALDADTIAVASNAEDSNTTSIINGSDLSTTNDSGSGNGAVYVFKRSGSTWSHEAYLKAPNTANSDGFGFSVALNADTIAVTSLNENSNTTSIINGSDLSSANNSGSGNGAVYVFKRVGSTWSHEAYLKSPRTDNSDFLGWGLGINGDTIVAGAPNENSNTTSIIHGSDLAAANNSGGGANGAAYVFKRSGSTWAHEAYLKAPNNSDGDQFGYSAAISGDTIVVGANQEGSSTTSIINGSDLSITNNGAGGAGAAYVFTRSGTTWSHQAYLKAPNSAASDVFASDLEISGDVIVVDAVNENSTTTSIINGADLSTTNNSGTINGAAYIFKRSGTTWSHQAYLKAPSTTTQDAFGRAVSVSGSTIVVTAVSEDSNTTSIINGSDLSSTNDSGLGVGAAYIYVYQ